MLRAAERFQQQFALTLVEAEQRVDIGAAIAVFGEEAGHRFGRMVGADHHAFGHPGDAVLRFHTLARFFVAAHEIAQLNARFAQRFLARQHGFFDVNGQHFVRLDERQRVLTIFFIKLYAEGQTHRDKLIALVAGFITQFADGKLAQFAGERGVLTAADAEHQGFQKRIRFQVGLQKIDAATDLFTGVNLRFHPKRLNNFVLQCHLPLQSCSPATRRH
ncbi:hypothetical protein BN133_577 [Cronobacter dublinensis 582]|nr:hypothetical protein BN133_577 [Cronobacter dublinensis 582]